jgi:hypothetical protein
MTSAVLLVVKINESLWFNELKYEILNISSDISEKIIKNIFPNSFPNPEKKKIKDRI